MVSTAANRDAFIRSTQRFLGEYGFQGIDLDWQFPGAPDRGGTDADADNFVSLVREMRATFNKNNSDSAGGYGISVPIPADDWYLGHYKLSEMEPHVDYFGFMAYGTHGLAP